MRVRELDALLLFPAGSVNFALATEMVVLPLFVLATGV